MRGLAAEANYDDIYQGLVSNGLSRRASISKANMFLNCCTRLIESGADRERESVLVYVPGRIELLGKHTDYAGGRSILAAAERGFCFAAVGRKDSRINLYDVSRVKKSHFNLESKLVPEIGHWTNYIVAAARRIARNFGEGLEGADIAFASDLPPAAGMSSSSVLITGFFLCIAHVNSLFSKMEFVRNINDNTSLAAYLGTIENGQKFGSLEGDSGVGTYGGSEDHTALLCCKRKNFSQYSFCPVIFERDIPLPEGYVMGIATSGVRAELTGNSIERFNNISMQASVLVDIWNRASDTAFDNLNEILLSAGIEYARGTFPSMINKSDRKSGFSADGLIRRFEQFVRESTEIIPSAGDCLINGVVEEFGRLCKESLELSDTHLGNQIPETMFLASSAIKLGAPASSAFSAGFGGSVWALVPLDAAVDGFFFEWAADYRKAFPARADNAEFFSTWLGPPSFRIGGAQEISSITR